MTIAERDLKKQLKSEQFRRSFLEETAKLDSEYRLEELKKAIQGNKSANELIEEVESIEKFGVGDVLQLFNWPHGPLLLPWSGIGHSGGELWRRNAMRCILAAGSCGAFRLYKGPTSSVGVQQAPVTHPSKATPTRFRPGVCTV
jgi:hypothetical protein